MTHPHTNRLAKETSPYLLQHAHNPVDWYPWGEEAFAKAREKDIPVIVSIGYSTCHWCHVMERESFENQKIADIMNEHFVCIKVDREERPDVDQVYMDAIHAMGVRGGWPLNVFLTADAKPFYGGTYYPKQNWSQLLLSVSNAYIEQREKLLESAEEFANALRNEAQPLVSGDKNSFSFTHADLQLLYEQMRKQFDNTQGGTVGAPKFPMPSLWRLALRIADVLGDESALTAAKKATVGMAHGGIYDHLGGGFARYSTDDVWLVPHFEKMLYDNGQMLSLMAELQSFAPEVSLAQTISQTIDYLEREMLSPEGGLYSAIDADSEGVEGKFYVWKKKEIADVLGDEAEEYFKFYHILEAGNWEEGNNIPHRKGGETKSSKLPEVIHKMNEKLLKAREQRIRPSTDTKIIASWNALAVSGLADSARYLNDERSLRLAIGIASFMRDHMWTGEHVLRSHGKDIVGFLEDHALSAQAFIDLYHVTFDEEWLNLSMKITESTIKNFQDSKDGFFLFSSKKSEKMIAEKKEVFDNVIPSGNAVMANVLTDLGLIFDRPDYLEMARAMLNTLKKTMLKEPRHLSNWAMVATRHLQGLPHVAIVGPNAKEQSLQLLRNTAQVGFGLTVVASEKGNDLPLLHDRKLTEDGKTYFHVCHDQTCQLPTASLDEALQHLENSRQNADK